MRMVTAIVYSCQSDKSVTGLALSTALGGGGGGGGWRVSLSPPLSLQSFIVFPKPTTLAINKQTNKKQL